MKLIRPLVPSGIASAAILMTSRAAFADCSTAKDCINQGVTASGVTSSSTNLNDLVHNVVITLLYIVGAAAVIMLIIGGFLYVISSGDSKRVESAKNTILYAIIGIVVALAAGLIVNWVFGQFAK